MHAQPSPLHKQVAFSPQKSGGTPREVLVDIDSLGRLWKAWPSPVVREDEGAAIGQELEERAAVQPQGFDDLPLCGLDFGIHLVGRQIDESCGHVCDEALKLQPVVSGRGYRREGLIRLVLQSGHDTATLRPTVGARSGSFGQPLGTGTALLPGAILSIRVSAG